MAGSVYVFNCYNEPASTFSVGGFSAGGIPAWNRSYQPESLSLRRIKHGDQRTAAQFAFGDNSCLIVWDSFSATTTVSIPTSGVSLDDDLILYVCTNQSMLLNTRGYVLDTFRVDRAAFQAP
jgi:hypothetical protein